MVRKGWLPHGIKAEFKAFVMCLCVCSICKVAPSIMLPVSLEMELRHVAQCPAEPDSPVSLTKILLVPSHILNIRDFEAEAG